MNLSWGIIAPKILRVRKFSVPKDYNRIEPNILFNVEDVKEVFAQSSEPEAHVKSARQTKNTN